MPSRRDARKLLPRDYLLDPLGFGIAPGPIAALPSGGDLASQRAALVQHATVLFLRRSPAGRRVGSRVGRLFGFSRQHWSDCLLGKSWMQDDDFLAVLALLLGLVEHLEGSSSVDRPPC